MGLNLNLVEMLGLPSRVTCPKCNNSTASDFDDYDVECGKPFPGPGMVSLAAYCKTCGLVWRFEGRLTFTQTSPDDKCDVCGAPYRAGLPHWGMRGEALHCPACLKRVRG